MSHFVRCVAAAAALLAAPVAIAQTAAEPAPAAAAPVLKPGAMLVSSDGKRVGRIERVLNGADGTPVSASLIVDSRFVYVPASTITASEKGFSTSLTRAEVRKLK